jgi:hypothetical protein
VIQDIGFVLRYFSDQQQQYCITQGFLLHYGLSAWHMSVFLMALWLFLFLRNTTLKVKQRLIILQYGAIFILPLIPCLAILITVSSLLRE